MHPPVSPHAHGVLTSTPCAPLSPSLSPRRPHAVEKRGKESSDDSEDSGGEKGSPRRDEAQDEKGPTPDGSSGDDDYRQVKSKRQKLKEKKKRQKAKKKEAAPPRLGLTQALFNEESERERLWILDSLKPSAEAVDQALAGHPAAHPLLLRLLMSADSLSPAFAQFGVDLSVTRPVLHRLILSPAPLTYEALTTALDRHYHTATL